MKMLDIITIGQSSGDLSGAQVGGRLEDMSSFNKFVGGSPINMATDTARLGLNSGLKALKAMAPATGLDKTEGAA